MSDPIPEDSTGARRTDAYCAARPQAAAIRALLLDLERRAHATGWDGPDSRPRLFQVDVPDRPDPAGAAGGLVQCSWCDWFTSCVKLLCDTNGGNVGAAMTRLAEVSEAGAQIMRTGTVPEGWEDAGGLDLAGQYPALVAAGQTGQDLGRGGRGWRLFGYGFRAEFWTSIGDIPGARESAHRHELHTFAHRQEARMLFLACRDGLIWTATRVRGGRPLVVMQLPEADDGHRGLIVNSLSRMVRAVVNNPVPVVPES